MRLCLFYSELEQAGLNVTHVFDENAAHSLEYGFQEDNNNTISD